MISYKIVLDINNFITEEFNKKVKSLSDNYHVILKDIRTGDSTVHRGVDLYLENRSINITDLLRHEERLLSHPQQHTDMLEEIRDRVYGYVDDIIEGYMKNTPIRMTPNGFKGFIKFIVGEDPLVIKSEKECFVVLKISHTTFPENIK